MSQVLTSKYPIYNYTLNGLAPDGQVTLPSAEKLMEFVYRIDQWQIDINVTETLDGAFPANGTYFLYTRSGNIDGVDDNVPTSERDLVVPNVRGIGGVISLNHLIPNYQFDWNLYENFAVTHSGGAEIAWYIQTAFSLVNTLGKGLDTTKLNISDPVSAVVCTIYGYPVTLYDIPGGVPSTWTGTITATPKAWWPYAPTSGGAAVFDSVTGSQINPNVVID